MILRVNIGFGQAESRREWFGACAPGIFH